jgi:multiple RNA-binding domain-containing protein 1
MESKSAASKPKPQPRAVELSEEDQFENKIKQTGRLFIRNILYESTEKEFRQLFEPYGALEEVHIAVDTRTGKSKGFVYIQFSNSDDAFRAYKSLDKQIFQGRLLHILPGEKKKDHRLDEFDLKNLPLKKQRELKRKDQATKSQFSWNSLYMNTDAVLESVAAKLGVTKSQLIDPENSNSAVKQALAEAHVIGDVRTYFEQKGVDLTGFNKKERDDKVILVKNFPYGTTIEEIGDLFSQYGQLKRMLMPPAGTIAIVEFRDIPSARTAFSKLAYRRFKKSILYLEKGPIGLFTKEPAAEDGVEQAHEDANAVEAKVNAHDIMGEGSKHDEDDDVVEGPTVSVFVKNLNFATKSGDLTEIFKGLPGFVIATVKTKPDPKKKDSVLSMGFGFVEFNTKQQAEVAISTMNGYVLEGHKLQLKLSHRQGGNNNNNNATTKGEKSTKSNKIIIKNLPFEASRKDVFELFGAFGNLKSVRVPKKFDKSARGFAFVEFTLLKEAENAMNQLHGVHLLGRRLVMQYAEADAEDVEEEIAKMTKKVKKQVATQQLGAARLAGKGKIELEELQDDFADL